MKRISLILLCLSAIVLSLAACSKDSDTPLYEHDTIEYDANRKILVAYFSWGGNPQHLAQTIADATGANIFRIETVNPYPTDYNECTEVAREELDNGVRPELNGTVENLDDYDVIFVGCPVWWHTAPMAIWSFLGQNYCAVLHLCFDLSGGNPCQNSGADSGLQASARIRNDRKEYGRCGKLVANDSYHTITRWQYC